MVDLVQFYGLSARSTPKKQGTWCEITMKVHQVP